MPSRWKSSMSRPSRSIDGGDTVKGRYIKPDGFEHFRIAEVYLPHESWMRTYDIEREIIWINTAAEIENNVVKLAPKHW